MIERRKMRLAASVVVLAGVTACGSGGHGSHGASGSARTAVADRVIEISMTDNAYAPAAVSVRQGETVTFRFRHDGRAVHEAVIGDAAMQDEHAKEMSSMDADHMHMADATSTGSVQPGASADVTVAIGARSQLIIGCHQPGHWAAGMRALIDVT